MHGDESTCQERRCDVMISDVVLCVFRRTFFDVTQVFQRHCVEISFVQEIQETRCRAVMFNEISVDVVLMSMM